MYKLQNQSIKRLSDGASIPLADGNMDYEEYKIWLSEGNIPEPQFTAAELLIIADKKAKQEAEELRKQAMLTGALYNGYQVSFTSEDGNGMLQVKTAFEMGLTSTTIHFANGTKMPILAVDFLPFALWFVTKRDAFFA